MPFPTEAHSARPPKRGLLQRPILLSFLIISALFAIALSIGLYWLATAGKTVISNEIRKEIVAKVQSSPLPYEQQAALEAEVDRVTDGFQNGQISLKQMILIAEALDDSPVGSIARYYRANGDPLQQSSLSPEEKEAAMQTILRFVHGVFEELIPETVLEDLIKPFVQDGGSDDYQDLRFRPDITDAELRAALDEAKTYADAAGIETTMASPNLAAEVREIVDRILLSSE